MSNDSEVYLGVDVSKESVDIRAVSAEGRVLSRKQRACRAPRPRNWWRGCPSCRVARRRRRLGPG